MDVATILRDRGKLWNKRVDAAGAVRARWKYTVKPHFELAWLVQDRDAPRGIERAVLIVRPRFVYWLNEYFGPYIGPHAFNDDVELSGVVSPSPDSRFQVALTDITRFKFKRPGQVEEFDFSSEADA